jgi:isoprenylcysteine carboxyl methyltransferase (ICMT) family protein YpbQ
MIPFFTLALAARFASLAVSRRHERSLRNVGAVEHGATVSRLLTIAHIAFYVAVLAESPVRVAAPDAVSWAGLATFGFGMIWLVYVIRALGPIWTVKLYVARDHPLARGAVFRIVRHPNYFLCIVPELVGLALAMHAYRTLVFGLPVYCVLLGARIVQEERVMRREFADYGR